MVSIPCKSYGKDNVFENHFLTLCRYLNFVKKSEYNLTATRKFAITSKFCTDMGKIYVIFKKNLPQTVLNFQNQIGNVHFLSKKV